MLTIEHLDAVGGDVPTLERVVVGGMPIAPALMARIERRLGAAGRARPRKAEPPPALPVRLPAGT